MKLKSYCQSGLIIGGMCLLLTAVFAFPVNTSQSLATVVNQTLKQHPRVLQNIAQKEAARAAIRQAEGGYLPRVDVRDAEGREATRSASTGQRRVTLNRTERSLVVTQSLFSGGSTYHGVKQREAEWRAAGHNERYVRETVTLQTVQAYLEVLRTSRLYQLTQYNVYVHQRILKKMQRKFNGGAGRRTDVDLALGRLAQRRSMLRYLEGLKQDAKTAFRTITGTSPNQLKIPALAKIPHSLQAAESIALSYHPGLRAAQESIRASSEAVSVSQSSLMPSVDVEFSATRYENLDGFPGRSKDVKGMLVANYNLYRGGSDVAAIDRAQHYRMAAMENRERVNREVREDVTNAWHALKTDRAQIVQLKQHLSASEHVLTGYKKQFDLGRRSLLDVLNMENEVFNTQVAVLNERYAIRYDTYHILATMGQLEGYFHVT